VVDLYVEGGGGGRVVKLYEYLLIQTMYYNYQFRLMYDVSENSIGYTLSGM